MAALGPLLDLITHATKLSSTGAGMLTTLPVLMMGLIALYNRHIRRILGESKGITLGILFIALACMSRGLNDSALCMILSALLAGAGVALNQALLPGFIKRVFTSSTAFMMGLYTTGIMGGAAIAAASAPRLNTYLGWQGTLTFWALPALLAFILWQVASRSQMTSTPCVENQPSINFWLKPRAWSLLIFFGVGTGAYTLVLAWLPPYYMELGKSRDMAGNLLAGLTLVEVIAGLCVAMVASHFTDRRPLLVTALACTLSGLAILILAPVKLALFAALLLGMGIGALFPLSLILTLDHVEDPQLAGELAAFVQGGGYIIASLTPFLAGWLKDEFSTLSHAWMGMLVGVALLITLALRFKPSTYHLVTDTYPVVLKNI